MTGFRSAQDLVAEAHAVESDIGVVEVEVAPGPVARVPAQRPKIGPAVGIDEVVEVNRFDPELSSARSAVDEGSALNAERGEATAVIQIAVVVVERSAAAAVSSADQARVAAGDACHRSNRDLLAYHDLRRIDAAIHLLRRRRTCARYAYRARCASRPRHKCPGAGKAGRSSAIAAARR